MPFNPGPLSAEHGDNGPIAEMVSHADFESRCDWCHTPFRGPDGVLCLECHGDVREQASSARGIHTGIDDLQNCSACHSDHKGRTASLTRNSVSDLPHNRFGFTLAFHRRDYDGSDLSCRTCHPAGSSAQLDLTLVRAACVDCHAREDAAFVTDHRKQFGDACLACHDGSDRLRGFNHNVSYPLELKHARVECTRCHIKDQYKGTPRECIQCHPDPKAHLGQFGKDCGACHTAAGWRPARLVKHTFPLDHGNRGKDSPCKACHPANYGTYTCYVCHDHSEPKIKSEHIRWGKWNTDCMRCHLTGKRIE